ncbi:MAG: hypothetical protein DRP11_04100 [Candidatus Aenigmatarchaeota archaeon]|nr:MAG: hypothetical protein DRP11_04100 [Candidatus Aenigmarchaeota archaeon]
MRGESPGHRTSFLYLNPYNGNMAFTPSIYSRWMKEVQEKKYEGILLEFILPLHSKMNLGSMRILDVGIGKGWFEDILRDRGMAPEIVGIDKVPFDTKGVDIIVGDGGALPLKEGLFDMVISFDTVHLISDTKDMVRVLKDNGLLLISIHCNEYNMPEKRNELLGRFRGMKVLKESVVGDPDKELSYVVLMRKGPWSSG